MFHVEQCSTSLFLRKSLIFKGLRDAKIIVQNAKIVVAIHKPICYTIIIESWERVVPTTTMSNSSEGVGKMDVKAVEAILAQWLREAEIEYRRALANDSITFGDRMIRWGRVDAFDSFLSYLRAVQRLDAASKKGEVA